MPYIIPIVIFLNCHHSPAASQSCYPTLEYNLSSYVTFFKLPTLPPQSQHRKFIYFAKDLYASLPLFFCLQIAYKLSYDMLYKVRPNFVCIHMCAYVIHVWNILLYISGFSLSRIFSIDNAFSPHVLQTLFSLVGHSHCHLNILGPLKPKFSSV